MPNIKTTTQLLDALKIQLANIEAELAKSLQPEGLRRRDAKTEALILKALHARGKKATAEQLLVDTGLTKGTLWRNLNTLEYYADVVFQVTHGGTDRKHTIVHTADNIALG